MTEDKYELAREDYEAINEAAEWFLGTRKPRTASEVRGILVRLYLAGMGRGIRLTKELIEEEVDRRWDS